MKPITFESIRNFLRTKKRGKKDGSDASFKRSDSFKRISIRRSYMDRGRKRAILRSTNVVPIQSSSTSNQSIQQQHQQSSSIVEGKLSQIKFNDIEIKNDVFVGHFIEPGNGIANTSSALSISKHNDDCLPNERCIDAEVEKQFCFKNKSLQEINELCGGERIIDNNKRFKNKPTNNLNDGITSTGCFVKAGSKMKKPIGTSVAVTTETIELPKRNDSQRLSSNHSHYQRNKRIINSNEYIQPIQKSSQRSKSHSNVHIDDTSNSIIDETITSVTQTTNMSKKNFLNQSIDSVYIQNDKKNITSIDAAASSTSLLMSSTTSVSHSHLNVCNNSNSNSNNNNGSTDTPSLVIFKTYCNESNAVDMKSNCNGNSQRYLETSFDGKTAILATTKTTTTTGDDYGADVLSIGAEGTSNVENDINKMTSKNNVTRTSLNNNNTVIISNGINSHTFKMPTRIKTAKTIDGGIVIRIPDSNLYNASENKYLNKKSINHNNIIGNDETSLNGKFTFEIYKELQRTKDSSELIRARFLNKPFIDCDQNTFDCNDDRNLQSSPDNATGIEENFRSMQLTNNIRSENFYYDNNNDLNEFDDSNIISPDSSIPYPLRIKTNPFTQQKEPYSVNLGRVWKQLNLGQDEQSLELPILNTNQLSQGNLKTKNESFKSMSSHDSGFSLTLTKQKTIFDRKAPKKPKRKSKVTLNRDGYYKKIHLISTASQQNSIKRHKKKKIKRPISPQEMLQRTLRRHIKQLKPPHSSITAINNVIGENFYETFGRYYKRKQQQQENNDNDVDFSQELSELEAFFEEHLKRLKDYYMQKKKLNEQTISELCQEYECNDDVDVQKPSHIDHVELNTDNYINEKYFMITNDTLKRKQKIKRKRRQSKPTTSSPISMTEREHSYHQSRSDDNVSIFDDYTFPHPDKRTTINTNKKKIKFHAREVREFNQSDGERSSLKYASLDFTNHMTNNLITSENVTPPYADIDFDAYDLENEKKTLGLMRGQKFKKFYENSSVSRRMNRKGVIVNKSTVSSEIYLSSIFPSILNYRSPSVETCKICCGKPTIRRFNRNNDEYDDTYENILDDDERYSTDDDDDDDYEKISSDEFSENEFIANSLGSELCLICDKLHSECSCSIETTESRFRNDNNNIDDGINSSTISIINGECNKINAIPPQKPPRRSKKLCYCDCTSGIYSSTFKSNTNQLNKRKIKRIKSKRHIGKNHSLRRDYYRNHSSKYFFFSIYIPIK